MNSCRDFFPRIQINAQNLICIICNMMISNLLWHFITNNWKSFHRSTPYFVAKDIYALFTKSAKKCATKCSKRKGAGGGRRFLTMLKNMQKWYRAASLTCHKRSLQNQPQQEQQHQQVGILNNQCHTYQDQAPAGSLNFNPGISGTEFCKIQGSFGVGLAWNFYPRILSMGMGKSHKLYVFRWRISLLSSCIWRILPSNTCIWRTYG